jgi:hypothetical protein
MRKALLTFSAIAVAAAAVAAAATPRIGTSIVLHGNDDRETIRVTLLGYVDNARSSNPYIRPSAGKRYLAVRSVSQISGRRGTAILPQTALR